MHAKFMLPAATLLALSFSPVRPFASAPTGPRLRRSVPRAQLSDEAPDAELFGGLEAEVSSRARTPHAKFSASRSPSCTRSWLAPPMAARRSGYPSSIVERTPSHRLGVIATP